MKKYFIIAFSILAIIVCLNHEVIAQNFHHLYGIDLQFENPGQGSVLLKTGTANHSGLSTVTIPDRTGTIVTDYSNYNDLLVGLKAIDSANGSHSGINWTSLGH